MARDMELDSVCSELKDYLFAVAKCETRKYTDSLISVYGLNVD